MKDPALFSAQAEILKAMAQPVRLAIVDYLTDGERCVCEIVEEIRAGRSNVSRHLALMQRAGVLASRRDGLKIYYRLQCPCVADFLRCTKGVMRDRVRRGQRLLALCSSR